MSNEILGETGLSKEQIIKIIKANRFYVNDVVGAAVCIENNAKKEGGDAPFVSQLIYNSCILLTVIYNLEYMFLDELYMDSKDILNAHSVLTKIIDECTRILTPINRSVSFNSCCDGKSIRIDEKAFTVVFMNLLQNALLYSPIDDVTDIRLECDDSNYIVITVKNKIDYSKRNNPYDRPGLGLPLSKKVIGWHNETLEYSEADGVATVVLSLPTIVIKKNLMLSASYTDYIVERFKPVDTFLSVIVKGDY